MVKKNLKPAAEYIDDSLELIKNRVDECKLYLEQVKWQDKVDPKEKEAEFKFQSTMITNYISWLNEYANLSGIIEFYKEMMKQDDSKQVRKGSSRSAFAEMIKGGSFDE